jgi:hypothetical protein
MQELQNSQVVLGQNNFKLFILIHTMAGEQANYPNSYNVDPNLRLRDLEEKQRVLKNQILLIGKNLIDIREKNTRDILEIKKDLDIIKTDIERLASFIDTAGEEFSKFARKDDVEILAKQMRMFQPFGGKK